LLAGLCQANILIEEKKRYNFTCLCLSIHGIVGHESFIQFPEHGIG
jgi:hypothetical protein